MRIVLSVIGALVGMLVACELVLPLFGFAPAPGAIEYMAIGFVFILLIGAGILVGRGTVDLARAIISSDIDTDSMITLMSVLVAVVAWFVGACWLAGNIVGWIAWG